MNGQPLWTVSGQRQDIRSDPNGRLVRGIVVSFTTNRGIAGEVFVPQVNYTPDYVGQAINAQVATMHQIADLTG